MARVWYINWHFLDISYFFKVESSAKIEMQPRKLGYWKNLHLSHQIQGFQMNSNPNQIQVPYHPDQSLVHV